MTLGVAAVFFALHMVGDVVGVDRPPDNPLEWAIAPIAEWPPYFPGSVDAALSAGSIAAAAVLTAAAKHRSNKE